MARCAHSELDPMLFLAALALTADPALAAPAPDYVEEGTVVKLTGVGPADAFVKQRKQIVGLYCGVEEGGMTREKGKWYSGSVTCGSEGNFYFYNVAIEIGDFGVDYAALTGHEPGQPIPGSEPVASVAAASPWPAGSSVVITGLSAADAHIKSAGILTGRSCTVLGDGLNSSGEGWFSGPLNCGGEFADMYFYQVGVTAAVAVGVVGAAPAAPVAAPVAAPSPFAAGKMVKVTDVGPSDALYATRTTIVGRSCTVVENALMAMPEGWYAGRLFCDDGKSYQLLQVKVAAP